jgi:hypothetical protein
VWESSSTIGVFLLTSSRQLGDGLSISLEGDGIAFGGDCYTTRGTWVRPGSDDKVFHLDPVSVEACKTLEKE